MAWGVKYRGEFADLTYSGSVNGLLWTIDIEQDGYTGSISEMVMGGDPMTFEYLSPGDQLIMGVIKGSKVTVNAISETNFQYTSLYSAENFKYRVSIYYGDTPTLCWRGYLTSEYSEPYDDVPYTVSITANDGLGLLKDIAYLDDDDDPFNGRRYESQIILDILGKIGVTEFKEYVNIYDTLMASDVTDSPFDQCLVDVDCFYTEDREPWPCYSVLEEILKKYNAVIRQVGGEFIIYRPMELTGTTVYGRYFTAYNTKTGISITPEQTVYRSGHASSLYDYNGGILMMTAPISKFTAEQDYGYRNSWLDNPNFTIKDFSTFNPNYWIAYWTKNNITATFGEDGGVKITGASTGPYATHYLFQQFGANGIVSTTDTVRLSFTYEILNDTGAATDIEIWVKIIDSTSTYWLQIVDENEMQWVTSGDIIEWTETSVPEGTTSYSFNRIVTGIPVDGPYTAYLYYTKANTFLTIKNFYFNLTSDEIVQHINPAWTPMQNVSSKYNLFGIIKWGTQSGLVAKYIDEFLDKDEAVVQEHTATNDLNVPEMALTYYLGDVTKDETGIDNIIEQFKGSLVVVIDNVTELAAADFVATWASAYYAGDVILSAIGDTIYFTSSVAGNDFASSASIANVSGDLSGTASTVTANAAGTKQKETLTLTTGTSGTIYITHNGEIYSQEYITSLAATITAFVSAHSSIFTSYNITITANATSLVFEEIVASGGFTRPIFYVSSGSDIEGAWAKAPPDHIFPAAATARVDKIVLSGTTGTANITVDATTKLASIGSGDKYAYTSSWHTRGNTEEKTLLQLIANEIRTLYSRERHFIQMQLRERSVTSPDLNILYNLQDSINTYNNYIRIFAINSGIFNVKKREWTIDMMEIGTGGIASYTADSTTTTVDNTIITVDNG